MKIKCTYCGNTATVKSYRERDGVVGSELVCCTCHSRTNESVDNRFYAYNKFLDELKENSRTVAEEIFESAMAEFWDKVNTDLREEMDGFEQEIGNNQELYCEWYEDDSESYSEKVIERIAKFLKGQSI